MTKQEFKKEFDGWHARYPGFTMPEPKIVMAIYYQDLQHFPLEVIRKAMPDVFAATPNFFPTAPIIKRACEAAIIAKETQGHLPRAKYHSAEHDCKLKGQKQSMSKARRLLFEISPYESFHVLCWYDFRPICPECGVSQQPWENPLIVSLMEQYPDDTELWCPLHKGTLLCEICQNTITGFDWIKRVYERRAAEAKQ